MRARLTKLFAGLTAVGALAFGGAALAGAANPPSQPVPPVASAPADTSAESASELAGPSDGPGGHADDPANASIDNQFQGEQ
jgi:hypothetical protein